MEYKKNYDLWQGGAWEQSSHPVCKPLTLPDFEPPKRRRPRLSVKRRRFPRWPFTLLGCLVLISVLVWGADKLLPSFSIVTVPPSSSAPTKTYEVLTEPIIPRSPVGSGVTVNLLPPALPPGQDEPLTTTQIYDQNVPSMVSIYTTSPHSSGSGTGIILTQDGYLLTNDHVISGAAQVRVALHNNQVLDAKLVGFDAAEDIAVLKVDADGLTPAKFGDSAALRCGDPVVALGDSLGYRSSITDGIVSALDREVKVDNSTMVLIQTSAPINFGNSGGALINQYGQVVGITTIKIVTKDGSAESLGFAIPSARVKYVADKLIAGDVVRQGSFGFTIATLPVDGGGLELLYIEPRSDCFAKGIQSGDILIRADGQDITCSQDLIRMKLTRGAGDSVELELLRDGKPYTVTITLTDSQILNETEVTP